MNLAQKILLEYFDLLDSRMYCPPSGIIIIPDHELTGEVQAVHIGQKIYLVCPWLFECLEDLEMRDQILKQTKIVELTSFVGQEADNFIDSLEKLESKKRVVDQRAKKRG